VWSNDARIYRSHAYVCAVFLVVVVLWGTIVIDIDYQGMPDVTRSVMHVGDETMPSNASKRVKASLPNSEERRPNLVPTNDVSGKCLRGALEPALCDPLSIEMTSPAPPQFNATFHTSAGPFIIAVHRAAAPLSADRFYHLVRHGFYDNTFFYRVRSGFVVQWGPSANPSLSRIYQNNCLAAPTDWPPCSTPGGCFWVEPRSWSNLRGTVAFSTDGATEVCECSPEAPSAFCNRTGGKLVAGSELFINLVDNSHYLDAMGFAPFGEVVAGMDQVVAMLTPTRELDIRPPAGGQSEAELDCQGNDIRLGCVYARGTQYLANMGNLSVLKTATLV